MLPFDIRQNLDELATSVERFYPEEPERAFEEFLGWGKGNIVASIAFSIAWEHLTFLYAEKNPILSTRPIKFSDLTKPSLN